MRTILGLALALAGSGTAQAQSANSPAGQVSLAERRSGEVDWSVIRSPRPVDSPLIWVSARDYPEEALRGGITAHVEVRVTIGADDQIAGCRIIDSRGDSGLAARVCPILQERGKFLHGLGADGKPIGGDIAIVADWWIADASRRPTISIGPGDAKKWPVRYASSAMEMLAEPKWSDFAPPGFKGRAMVAVKVYAHSDARPHECTILKSGGVDALDAATCKAAMAARYSVPPSNSGVTVTFSGQPGETGYGLPMMVRWDSQRASLQLPGKSTPVAPRSVKDLIVPALPAGTALSNDRARAMLRVSETGKVTGCRIGSSTGSDLADWKACRYYLDRLQLIPATDVFGQPMTEERAMDIRFAQ